MENLGKTNGSEPVSVEVSASVDSRVDVLLWDFLRKLDNAVEAWLTQAAGSRHEERLGALESATLVIEERLTKLHDPDAPSNSELDGRLAELNDTVDNFPDAYEAAVGVVEDNGEGFVREDDMPDQILTHVGETLDKDQIVELIKSVVGTVLGKVEIRLSYGDSFDAYLHQDE